MGLIEPLTTNSQLTRPCFSRHDLLRVIRAVAHGKAIFSPAVATRVLDFFARQHDPSIAPEDFPMLTTRERDVLHCSPRDGPTPRSRPGWACRARPPATTSR